VVFGLCALSDHHGVRGALDRGPPEGGGRTCRSAGCQGRRRGTAKDQPRLWAQKELLKLEKERLATQQQLAQAQQQLAEENGRQENARPNVHMWKSAGRSPAAVLLGQLLLRLGQLLLGRQPLFSSLRSSFCAHSSVGPLQSSSAALAARAAARSAASFWRASIQGTTYAMMIRKSTKAKHHKPPSIVDLFT